MAGRCSRGSAQNELQTCVAQWQETRTKPPGATNAGRLDQRPRVEAKFPHQRLRRALSAALTRSSAL